jgi:hypothetical protein
VVAGALEDAPAAQRLSKGVRQWLRARSVEQWQDPIADATVVPDIKQRHFFLVRMQRDARNDSETATFGSPGGRRVASQSGGFPLLRREFIHNANTTMMLTTSAEPTEAQLGKPSAPNIPPLAWPSWTTGRNSNAAHPTAERLKNAIALLSPAFTESPFSSYLQPTATPSVAHGVSILEARPRC